MKTVSAVTVKAAIRAEAGHCINGGLVFRIKSRMRGRFDNDEVRKMLCRR